MTITRFAPSPTGFLHLGGARTALFNWLHAKRNNGKFLLRIEDTDLKRSTQEATDAIINSMNWLGLKNDEQVYYQTKNFGRYREVINAFIDQGKAYYCRCSKERLEQLRQHQQANNLKIGYDSKCRDINYIPKEDEEFVVRFKNPSEGLVIWNDAVKGQISIANRELDDMVIQRADGSPTYNFCVAVDDVDMDITHVVRGNDHVNNTPKQVNIYYALKAKIPVFAHLPMILGQNGEKLSKRQGAVDVMQYREDGYLPQAVLNYLVRLGWSNGDQEVFSIDEMIDNFNFEHINASPSRFDFQKLKWLNRHYIKESKLEDIQSEVEYHFAKAGLAISNGPSLQELIIVMAEKIDTLKELVEKSSYFYKEDIIYNESAIKKHFKTLTGDILKIALTRFSDLSNQDWQDEFVLHSVVSSIAKECKCGLGKVGMPIRIAVTGSDQSPSIDATLKLLGKNKVISRLNKALKLYFSIQ